MKEKKLKMIGRVKPAFSEEDFDKRPREEGEGEFGKGPLARHYCSNLDMEFYASRGRDSEGDTGVISLRLSNSSLFDIGVMVESKKLPFRTKSEFVRSAIFILANYFGQKFPSLGLRSSLEDGIASYRYYEKLEKDIGEYRRGFEDSMKLVVKKSDKEVEKFLSKQVLVINSLEGNLKEEIVREFSAILIRNGINPIPYFGGGEEEEELS